MMKYYFFVYLYGKVQHGLTLFHTYLIFPDMPCMKRVYRDKKGEVPLVGGQEERTLLVLVVNW